MSAPVWALLRRTNWDINHFHPLLTVQGWDSSFRKAYSLPEDVREEEFSARGGGGEENKLPLRGVCAWRP